MTPFTVDHACGAPAFALRIAYGGKTIVYSGDTAWTETLVEAVQGADLFVCESYFFDKKIRYHLDYATLKAQRHRLECGRVILTHMSDDMLSRRRRSRAAGRVTGTSRHSRYRHAPPPRRTKQGAATAR